ncbi:MAG: hypothetical protein ACXV5L_13235, partial [Thermoanaerobaculia bacterium]
MVSIVENYKQYVPPKAARKSVERLLSSLPSGNLTGVEAIVLTNSSSLGKGKTKRVRGRKYPENRCLGFYHPNARDSGPWIELVVDNIVGEAPPFFLRWRLLSDFMFASTLYHEIGHHL